MKELNLSIPDGLCHLTTTKILNKKGGYGILNKYNHSPNKLLAAVYPEYKTMCRDVVTNIMKDLRLEKVEDILKVPLEYP